MTETLAILRHDIAGLGRVYAPPGDGPFPAILLLHGSEGGWSGWNSVSAALFAAHGFVACPHAYSRGGNAWHAGDILDIPLENTAAALARLRDAALTDGKIGIYGASRGAEHALLLAALMAEDGDPGLPDAIAVHAAADIVHGPWKSATALDWGLPAPPAPQSSIVRQPPKAQSTDVAWTWRGAAERTKPGTVIEIERYVGPLFMSHGEADEVWSFEMTRRLAARARDAGRPAEMHIFEGERHLLGAAASNRQLAAVIAFFRRHLGPAPA